MGELEKMTKNMITAERKSIEKGGIKDKITSVLHIQIFWFSRSVSASAEWVNF